MIMKFIKRLISTINYELSVMKAEREPDTLPNVTPDMVNREGYILIHNHNAVRRAGKVISHIMQVSLGIDPTPVVVVDDDFYKLSKESQEVVIEHELAHFSLHACESDSPDIDATMEDELRKDREADAEVFHVFREKEKPIIKALKEMREIINTKEYIAYYNIRIECIRRYAKVHRRRTMTYEDIKWAAAMQKKVVYTVNAENVVVY